MTRIVVFGNSGSGKSTYAKLEAARLSCPHLDLDTIAWGPNASSPKRESPSVSQAAIASFMDAGKSWVIEGCYADLLEFALGRATELVFLNPGTGVCAGNARSRAWEPHKYPSKEAQDANLAMLVEWIEQYDERSDEFSLAAHQRLFDGFAGSKHEYRSNQR